MASLVARAAATAAAEAAGASARGAETFGAGVGAGTSVATTPGTQQTLGLPTPGWGDIGRGITSFFDGSMFAKSRPRIPSLP